MAVAHPRILLSTHENHALLFAPLGDSPDPTTKFRQRGYSLVHHVTTVVQGIWFWVPTQFFAQVQVSDA